MWMGNCHYVSNICRPRRFFPAFKFNFPINYSFSQPLRRNLFVPFFTQLWRKITLSYWARRLESLDLNCHVEVQFHTSSITSATKRHFQPMRRMLKNIFHDILGLFMRQQAVVIRIMIYLLFSIFWYVHLDKEIAPTFQITSLS